MIIKGGLRMWYGGRGKGLLEVKLKGKAQTQDCHKKKLTFSGLNLVFLNFQVI